VPYYLMLSKLTERGRDRIKHDSDRITQVNLEIEEGLSCCFSVCVARAL